MEMSINHLRSTDQRIRDFELVILLGYPHRTKWSETLAFDLAVG